MLDFLAWMFSTPEAQTDPYAWGSVLLAHFAIGIVLAAVVGSSSALLHRYAGVCKIDAWQCAALVNVVYSLAWEGNQIVISGSTFVDGFIDALAVSCGSLVAAGAWKQRGVVVGLSIAVMAFVGIKGVRDRR